MSRKLRKGRRANRVMSPARELPPTGPLPRPESPEEAREVLRREAFPAPDVQRVTLEAVEFTSICPRTGQPDFGTVTVEYIPGERCLESKSLKYYLWSYRDEGAFCETLAGRPSSPASCRCR
jgi:7-cyano-7-deazaguanine reductase